MNWKTKLGIGASIASLMLLTACGGATGGGNTAGDSGGGTILVGVITPTSGSSAQMGKDMNNAIQMAADEVNKNGGVLGKQIKLEFEDDGCDPQMATAAANKLVSNGAVAVVGGYCSGSTLPATGVLHQAGIPWVVTAANSAKIPAQGYNNIFLLNSTVPAQAQTAAEYMLNTLHAKNVAILNDNTAYSVDLAQRTKEDVEKMGGKVVAFDAVNPEEKDFTSELTKLKNLKPDATYWTAYYAAGGLLLKQFKQLGVPGAFGVGDGSNDVTIIKIAGAENAEGMFTTTAPTPQFEPSAKDWIAQYKSRFNADPGPYSAISYDGMRLIADAIKRAGSTDKAAIVKALAETKDFKTFAGPVSFTSSGEPTKSNFIVLVVKNGKYELAH
jgi:branched-chain amino acid transport system substrate-binding protein